MLMLLFSNWYTDENMVYSELANGIFISRIVNVKVRHDGAIVVCLLEVSEMDVSIHKRMLQKKKLAVESENFSSLSNCTIGGVLFLHHT